MEQEDRINETVYIASVFILEINRVSYKKKRLMFACSKT